MSKKDEAVAAVWGPVSAREHVGAVAPVARRIVLRAAVVAAAVVVLPASVWFGSGHAPAPAVHPCASEDSVSDCYWDADERGNGGGRSFEVRGGVIRYADGDTVTIPASELEGVER